MWSGSGDRRSWHYQRASWVNQPSLLDRSPRSRRNHWSINPSSRCLHFRSDGRCYKKLLFLTKTKKETWCSFIHLKLFWLQKSESMHLFQWCNGQNERSKYFNKHFPRLGMFQVRVPFYSFKVKASLQLRKSQSIYSTVCFPSPVKRIFTFQISSFEGFIQQKMCNSRHEAFRILSDSLSRPSLGTFSSTFYDDFSLLVVVVLGKLHHVFGGMGDFSHIC